MRANQTYTFYHGTDAGYKDSILTHGLIPGKGRGGDTWARINPDNPAGPGERFLHREPSVYVSPYIEESRWFGAVSSKVNGGNEAVIFAITLPTKLAEKMRQDEADSLALRFMGEIPAKYIRVVETIPHPNLSELESEAFDLRHRLWS